MEACFGAEHDPEEVARRPCERQLDMMVKIKQMEEEVRAKDEEVERLRFENALLEDKLYDCEMELNKLRCGSNKEIYRSEKEEGKGESIFIGLQSQLVTENDVGDVCDNVFGGQVRSCAGTGDAENVPSVHLMSTEDRNAQVNQVNLKDCLPSDVYVVGDVDSSLKCALDKQKRPITSSIAQRTRLRSQGNLRCLEQKDNVTKGDVLLKVTEVCHGGHGEEIMSQLVSVGAFPVASPLRRKEKVRDATYSDHGFGFIKVFILGLC